jgi:uncharacterized protein (DUF2225 family)
MKKTEKDNKILIITKTEIIIKKIKELTTKDLEKEQEIMYIKGTIEGIMGIKSMEEYNTDNKDMIKDNLEKEIQEILIMDFNKEKYIVIIAQIRKGELLL